MKRLFVSRDKNRYAYAELWNGRPKISVFSVSNSIETKKVKYYEGENIGYMPLSVLNFLLDKPLKQGQCIELPKGLVKRKGS